VLAAVFMPRAQPELTVIVRGFSNESGDRELDPLAGALGGELVRELARTPGLRVVARSTSEATLANLDLLESLQADALIEGALLAGPEGVRAAVRARKPGVQAPFWNGEFAGVSRGLGTLAAAIRRGVLEALGRKVTPPASRASEVPVAQEAYLRARYFRAQRKLASIRQSVAEYSRAVEADSRWAEAWSGLAEALATLAFHEQERAGEVQRAKIAARRALALDDGLAEAHEALARLAFFHDREWNEAERGFRRALDADPGYGRAHQGWALSLCARARFAEAIQASERAAALDPVSFAASNDLAVIYYAAGDLQNARRQLERVKSLDPDSPVVALLEGSIFSASGRFAEAAAAYESLPQPVRESAEAAGRAAYAYARLGDRTRAEQLLASLRRGKPSHVHEAMALAGLGRLTEAATALENGCRRGESDCVFMAVEPHFRALRGLPAFERLRSTLGL
jgi:serine/threonine-protein kinase